MRTWLATAAFGGCRVVSGFLKKTLGVGAVIGVGAARALAQPTGEGAGGEASLKLPDLSSVSFLNGAIDGHRLLAIGILFCIFGLAFGMVIYMRLKNLPVHRSMREISELIYETCKTYLVTQGKFILLLWAFIAVIILLYFGLLEHMEAMRVVIILGFSLVGIGGQYLLVVLDGGHVVVAVDATPASQRPYVGGTVDDSELSLSFGHNGFGRVLGERNSPTPNVVIYPAPGSLRQASEALGATHWKTTWKVVLPSARAGLVTAAILAIARGPDAHACASGRTRGGGADRGALAARGTRGCDQ